MSKKETDISLIRKYLAGELDTHVMHRLERRAQDDPFFMDALEGYEKTNGDPRFHLNDLTNRLKTRVARKETRIIPFRFVAAAASVLVVLTIGGLLLYKSQPEKPKTAQTVATSIKITPPPPSKLAPDKSAEIAVLKAKPHPLRIKKSIIADRQVAASRDVEIANEIASADHKAKEVNKKDTIALNEVVVMGYATQHKRELTASVTTVDAAVPGKLLQGRAAGLNVKTAGAPVAKKVIKGRIVGKDDGLPIAGASVRVAGTNIGAVTDVNGLFNLPADSNKTKLVIAYIGYSSRQVNIRNRDSLNTIALEPNNSALSEVVVVGYGAAKKGEDATVIDAHPQAGWGNFKKYLKEHAISPDGKTGVVKLSFKVEKNGLINNITVIKGLSPATNQKAIELINDCPAWAGSSTGKTEKVKVRVKFVK